MARTTASSLCGAEPRHSASPLQPPPPQPVFAGAQWVRAKGWAPRGRACADPGKEVTVVSVRGFQPCQQLEAISLATVSRATA